MKKNERRDIAAVVVTYNRLDLLKECIDALKQQTITCNIVIIDNHSTDGTKEYLDSMESNEFPLIQSISLSENLGGAGGFNYGMRYAVEQGYSHIWIMDDDSIPWEDALEQLLVAEEKIAKTYGFLSSTVLWKDGHECVMNRQIIAKRFHEQVELLQDGIIEIQQATFVSLLFPRESILTYGLPIKEYFIWGDDVEYTRRIALRGGMKSYLVGKSIVTHKMKENSGSDVATDDVSRLPRYVLAYRNEACTYRKQGMKGQLLYLRRWILAIRRVLRFSKNYRFKRIGAILKGVILGGVFRPKVEYINDTGSKK